MVARGRRYAPQGPLFTIDELLQLAAYPGQPEALAAFYYQSERWVRALLEMLEAEELPVFLSAMSAGQMTWREVLEGHLGISSEQIERLARMAGGPPAP